MLNKIFYKNYNPVSAVEAEVSVLSLGALYGVRLSAAMNFSQL